MLLINHNNSIQISITIYKYSMKEILSVDLFIQLSWSNCDSHNTYNIQKHITNNTFITEISYSYNVPESNGF